MLDLRPLRTAGFRHLAAAYWVNEFGNWIGEIALTVLVWNRTHSPLVTAALFLALRCAPALFAPLLTARVEALNARVVLPTLYSLEAVFFVGLAVLTQHFSLPPVLVLAILDGALAVTAKALTRSATATGLVRAGLLREGNGILNLGAMASTASSPVIAGVLIAWKSAGPRGALLVDAGTFLLTAIIVARAQGIHVESNIAAGFAGRLRGGLGTVRAHVSVRRLVLAIAAVMLLSAVPIPIEVVFARRTLHAGDVGYGLLLASWGAGMVIGAVAFTLINDVRLVRVIAVGTLLNAIGYGGTAASPTLALACAASVAGGIGNGTAWVAAVTAVQERIPLDTQSAVMTVLEGLNQVMPAIGFAIGGVLTAVSSPRVAYAIAAIGIATVIVIASRQRFGQIVLSRDIVSPGSGPPGDSTPNGQESAASPRNSSIPTFTIG